MLARTVQTTERRRGRLAVARRSELRASAERPIGLEMLLATPQPLCAQPSTPSPRHDRVELAALLEEREAALVRGQSERDFCKSVGVARSTVRDEVGRVQHLKAMAPEVAAFWTSHQGQLQLMRIVLAAHLVMTLLGPCGVAAVSAFLVVSCLISFSDSILQKKRVQCCGIAVRPRGVWVA